MKCHWYMIPEKLSRIFKGPSDAGNPQLMTVTESAHHGLSCDGC